MELTEKEFENQKKQILQGVDLSRKGSVDILIQPLIKILNDSKDYVTTSSCSGRVVLFVQDNEFGKKNKYCCKWLYTSHDIVDEDELYEQLDPCKGDLVLKFEPFILHVQCRTISAAKAIQKCALSNAYRNSGMILGQHRKITFAVRSTQCLEVPLSKNGEVLITQQFIGYLVETINEKMTENKLRIEKFTESVKCMLQETVFNDVCNVNIDNVCNST